MNRHLGSTAWPKIFACDGAAAPDPRYDEFKRRLQVLLEGDPDFQGGRLLKLSSWVHLAGTLQEAFSQVETEVALVFQHDHEVIREVDPTGILACFSDPAVNHLRLNRHANTVEGWDYILETYPAGAVPLLKTAAWSDMPHFTRPAYYRDFVIPKLRDGNGNIRRVFPESVLFQRFREEVGRIGFAQAHPRFGTFVYGAFGDPPVTHHIDGKGFGVLGYERDLRRTVIWPP